MNKAFELIVFDWDGTLMDSERRIIACLRAAANDSELPELDDTALCNVIGLGLTEAIAHLYPAAHHEQHLQMTHSYRYHYLQQNTVESPLFKGVEPLLTELKEAGYWLAVATGKGRQGLDQSLEETGMADFFLTTRCASETRSKPHPEMLQDIMLELAVEPEDTLMIGDTEYDMLLAKNAGTHALAVSYGVHSLDRLLQHEPLGHLDDIRDLNHWLASHQQSKK